MPKRLSPAAIVALKDALCAIYWYKSDLRSFVHACVSDPGVLSTLNWDNYKRQTVSDLVDRLCSAQDQHLGDLTRLCAQVTAMRSFEHLRVLDGGADKARRAEAAVAQLRDIVEPHQAIQDEDRAIHDRQQQAAAKLRSNTAVRQKLDQVKTRYLELAVGHDRQARGYELERLLYDLFELFDLAGIIHEPV